MLNPNLLRLLAEPGSQSPLVAEPGARTLVSAMTQRVYRIEGAAVDFADPMAVLAAPIAARPEAQDEGFPAAPMQQVASELRAYHDCLLDGSARKDVLYDNLHELPTLTQVAHYRRIELLELLDLPSLAGAVAMDFGSGPWGFAAVFPKLRSAAIHITCDVSFEALRQAQFKGDVQPAPAIGSLLLTSDGDSIGLIDDCVDIAWAGEVIEHVRSPRLFLQEIARVLKPGGYLVLSTPNRDAPIYAARGLHNTVGPEHIALLGASELRSCASEYFNVLEVMGFEFSLCHEFDALIRDADTLRKLQERATHHPDLSSGILVRAQVDKERYRKGRRAWRRSEQLWSQCRTSMPDALRPIPLFGPVHGGFLEDGCELTMDIEASTLILLFWAHAWSGKVRIVSNGVDQTVDLYSHAGGFRRVEFNFADCHSRKVVLSRMMTRRNESQDSQVIFYKAIAYRTDPPNPLDDAG